MPEPTKLLPAEQDALLSSLAQNGFVRYVPSSEPGRMKAEYKDKAAETFADVSRAFTKERDVYYEALRAKAEPLREATVNLNASVVKLKNGNLSSDYGFFLGDTGARGSSPRYGMLPHYYAKIEKGLKGHPALEKKWAAVKALSDDVIAHHRSFPDIDYEVLRSIESVQSLCLVDIPCMADGVMRADFFTRLSVPINHPIPAATKAELGEKSVRVLKKCADSIAERHEKNEKAMTLVKAVRDFADALEARNWPAQFAELNKKAAIHSQSNSRG